MPKHNENNTVASSLNTALEHSLENHTGAIAAYIPELAEVDPELTGAAIQLNDGTTYRAGNCDDHHFTLQSTAKLVSLIGLLEEFGEEQVFKWINVEPTGGSFSAIDYTERFSHLPSNPMINAGAIVLCSHIPGKNRIQKQEWLDTWMHKLFNAKLRINHKIYTSEYDSADRNRSLAYLMRSDGILKGDIETTLQVYTALCSFEATTLEASYLPMLLANGGCNPNGEQIISQNTVKAVISIMATCGLYNETGMYMLNTGMPAKSGVSGCIMAVGIGQGGIAVFSPRLTNKGGSVRGHMILNYLADKLGWHFALARS